MRFPAKKNAGCPKTPRDFPPRKDGILLPWSGCLGPPLPLPNSLYRRAGGQTDTEVTTKFSRIDKLPNLLSYGAPLCSLRPQRSSAITACELSDKRHRSAGTHHDPSNLTETLPPKNCENIFDKARRDSQVTLF